LERQLADLQKEKKSLASKQQALTKEASSLKEKVGTSAQAAPAVPRINPEETRAAAVAKVKDDISLLEMRKSALNSSLLVVKSSYAAGSTVAGEFGKEEKQLQEYLSVLKVENDGLREKIAALKSALSGKGTPTR